MKIDPKIDPKIDTKIDTKIKINTKTNILIKNQTNLEDKIKDIKIDQIIPITKIIIRIMKKKMIGQKKNMEIKFKETMKDLKSQKILIKMNIPNQKIITRIFQKLISPIHLLSNGIMRTPMIDYNQNRLK